MTQSGPALVTQYLSASTYPAKLIADPGTIAMIKRGFIPPIHVQLSPTNRCTRACSFCNCRGRDKDAELSLAQIMQCLRDFFSLGARALTITGGGEPLCYPDLDAVIEFAANLGYDVGLITNGDLLSVKPSDAALHRLTWCRISASDETNQIAALEERVAAHFSVDWALSYVVTAKFDSSNLMEHIAWAERANMTHIRILEDHTNLGKTLGIEQVEALVGVDNPRIIYQHRKEFFRGPANCRIGLLKPYVGSEGNIYPCCGIQFALGDKRYALPKELSLCAIEDIKEFWHKPTLFNGSQCVQCYYQMYNDVLRILTSNIAHGGFL